MQIRKSLLGAILFALLLTFATVPKARKLGSPDFHVFHVAARHVLVDPENLYRISPDRYLYPPSAAVLLTPFALTDNFTFFQWAWHGMLGLLLAALASVSGAALAAMVLLTRYLANSFGYGQINLVVMAILFLVGIWLRKRPAGAGAAWAVATGFKVYPAIFAPAFLPKGQRRGFFWGLGAGALLLLLPFVVFGPALGMQLYGEFVEALRAKGSPLHSHNQSITAIFLRLFSGQGFELHGVGETNWSVSSLPEGLLRAAAYVVGGALAFLSWRKALREPERASGLLSAGAFSVIFLSHIVWKDYLLFLYFPLTELFTRLPRRQSYVLAGSFLAIVTLSSMDVVGASLSSRLDAACIHLWAAGLVWLAWIKLR